MKRDLNKKKTISQIFLSLFSFCKTFVFDIHQILSLFKVF